MAAHERRPPGSLAERFWSIARSKGPAAEDETNPDPRAVIRHVLRILDSLAAGEVGDDVSQSTVSFLALLRQQEAAGDLSYASPEQARGDAIDERSLVFSVGVLIFEELTGRHPFGAVASGRRFARMQKFELGSGVQYFPQVPAQLRTVLMRAMGPFPEERYPSLKALRAELERYADGRAEPEPAPRPRPKPLKGLPPTPADLLFGSVEDQIPTMVHHKLAEPAAQAKARKPSPASVTPIVAAARASQPPKRAGTRVLAERLGFVAIGAVGALALSLMLAPKLRSPAPPTVVPAARAPVSASAPIPSPSNTPQSVNSVNKPSAGERAIEPPAVPPVAPPVAKFDPELAARNALSALRTTCFADLDHTVAFGAGILYGPSSPLSRRAFLSPDEPLSPDERRCVGKALIGVSAGGAAPDKTTVPELRLRLRADSKLDTVKVSLPK